MKKRLCLALALIMILVVATACKKDDENNNNNGTPDYDGYYDGDGNYVDDGYNYDEDDATLEECEAEVVYVVNAPNGLNLRSSMYTEGAAASWVKEGTALRRIAKGEVWSKVIYENQEYYAATKYLSTSKDGQPDGTTIEVQFTECNETVYLAEAANLRSTPDKSDNTNVVKSLAAGTELTRTGVMYEAKDPIDNPDGTLGWSRVVLEGKTYYIRNSVLTTEKPAA